MQKSKRAGGRTSPVHVSTCYIHICAQFSAHHTIDPIMTVFSKLTATCHEAGHPWSPSCLNTASEIGVHAFVEGLRLYLPFYLVSSKLARVYDTLTRFGTDRSYMATKDGTQGTS